MDIQPIINICGWIVVIAVSILTLGFATYGTYKFIEQVKDNLAALS
jgi:hypothetical protein